MSDYARFKEINKLLASGHPELAREELRGLQAHVIALHDEVSRLHARIGNFEELLSIPRAVTQENGLVWINTGPLLSALPRSGGKSHPPYAQPELLGMPLLRSGNSTPPHPIRMRQSAHHPLLAGKNELKKFLLTAQIPGGRHFHLKSPTPGILSSEQT